MKHALRFTKASGAGNDFVLLDNRNGSLPDDQSALARALCSRPFGIGGDGLLILEKSGRADFAMKYYNADGSYGGMCGNGGRCIARYAHRKGIVGKTMAFEALGHVYRAECLDEEVRLAMKDPGPLEPQVRLSGIGSGIVGTLVDTGAPHYVILVDDLDATDVTNLGRSIRHHPRFQPAGTNVNFVKQEGAGAFLMRTYERGVEAETLACGTGSVAVACVAMTILGSTSPVIVRARSGERLIVSLDMEDGRPFRPVLQGSAHLLFEGTLLYDDSSGTIA